MSGPISVHSGNRHCWSMTAATCSLTFLLMLSVGCAGLPTSGVPTDTIVQKKKAPRKHGDPNQIVLTANPCWLQDADKPTHTGLFCRMYFFDGNDPIPLSINGELQVIAYDAAKEGSPEKPQGIYKVATEELGRHYRPDVVGDSYVFWFHYQTTEVADLQIQATLKLKNGKEVTSGWVKIQLDPEAISAEDAMAKMSSRKVGASRPSLTYVPQGNSNQGKSERKQSPVRVDDPQAVQQVDGSQDVEQVDEPRVITAGARELTPSKPVRTEKAIKPSPSPPAATTTNRRSSGEL